MDINRNELNIEAFLSNANKVNTRNPLHSALVTGVDVWRWSVPLVLDVLGDEWLDIVWSELSLKKPTISI